MRRAPGRRNTEQDADGARQCTLWLQADGAEPDVTVGLDARPDDHRGEARPPYREPGDAGLQQPGLESVIAKPIALRLPGVLETTLARGDVDPITDRCAGVSSNDSNRHLDRHRSCASEGVVGEDGQNVQLPWAAHVPSSDSRAYQMRAVTPGETGAASA